MPITIATPPFYQMPHRTTAKNVGNLSVTHSSCHLVNISVLLNMHNIYDSPSRMVSIFCYILTSMGHFTLVQHLSSERNVCTKPPACLRKHWDKKAPQTLSEASPIQAWGLLPCPSFGTLTRKAASILLCCLAAPGQAVIAVAKSNRLTLCYFGQRWASTICKSWHQKCFHFIAVLHIQKKLQNLALSYPPKIYLN